MDRSLTLGMRAAGQRNPPLFHSKISIATGFSCGQSALDIFHDEKNLLYGDSYS